MIKRLKGIRKAYVWMLQFHPDEEYGMFFVLHFDTTKTPDIESEYRRWKHGRSQTPHY